MKRKIRAWFRRYDEEIFIFLGFALLVMGAYTLYPSASWFVAGVESLAYAFLLAQGKKK